MSSAIGVTKRSCDEICRSVTADVMPIDWPESMDVLPGELNQYPGVGPERLSTIKRNQDCGDHHDQLNGIYV